MNRMNSASGVVLCTRSAVQSISISWIVLERYAQVVDSAVKIALSAFDLGKSKIIVGVFRIVFEEVVQHRAKAGNN